MPELLPSRVKCVDFFDFLEKTEDQKRRLWGYRGHGNRGSQWIIESKLTRFLREHTDMVKESWWPARERAAITRFKRGANLHLSHLPSEDESLSWLALMQHYGAPTRLIDCTFSPAVGFFFAIHDATPKDAYSVHAIHLKTLAAACFERVKTKAGKRTPGGYYTPTDEDYKIGREQTEDFVGVYASRFNSPRQQAQEGLFLVPSKIGLNIEEWLQSLTPDGPEHHWIEFTFKIGTTSYEKNVRQFLQIAMSPAGLFPGLEGLAQSARYSWFDVSRDYQPEVDL